MNIQQVYNKAVSGVLVQGCRSVEESRAPTCALRGASDAKCAVGHLIADADYSAHLEEESYLDGIFENMIYDADALDYFRHTDIGKVLKKNIGGIGIRKFKMLVALQNAHDDSRNFEDVVRGFRDVAKDFSLSDKVVADWQKAQ